MSIDKLISDFSTKTLSHFFRQKLSTFRPEHEDYSYLFENKEEITDNYVEINKLGETDLDHTDDLLIITAKTVAPLTDKTGKKRQFEIAKRILKEENKDAAFFVFYDEKGNFRFSFIRVNFLGANRTYTHFKRYTYFVSPAQTNKTFKKQISVANFNRLDSILEAFNVEPVTKEFYIKLQHWYFWALEQVKFPKDAEAEPHGREIAVIRMITRIIFIWFMRVRRLVPDELFDEKKIEEFLSDFSPDSNTYYLAILHNLFFATLNTDQKDRRFQDNQRFRKGFNNDFGNHNVYRYYDLIKDADRFKTIFQNIPFLNGGLFECLDYKTKEKEERKYIDGFTSTKGQQPMVPNFLFFGDEKQADISKYFGTTGHTYPVQGLIKLLESYNFTIDENDPDDVEVALDPELLGSIFENLLASYNPETATTARKATGSFYTPPEIVNFMTVESLKNYFMAHIDSSGIENFDEKLHDLLTVNDSENPFDEIISRQLTEFINDLRIVDPAVGSGAFPMTILNKLVFILGKLDPENHFWQESQIKSVEKAVSDPMLRHTLIANVQKRFKEKNADYGRKLFLIEKCIYGVDIQQIAVEIAKLRFFISLLVDESIDFGHPENNYGIETLPNLDFKFMQGDSLIATYAGIDFSRKQNKDVLFDVDEGYNVLINEFEELKNLYQNESEKHKKDDLRKQIDQMILRIFEEKLHSKIPLLKNIEANAQMIPGEKQQEAYRTAEKEKLNEKLGFDLVQTEKDLIAYTEGRKPKRFFLWDVYFAEVFSQKKGFDIVIGNPPYIQLQKAVDGNRNKFADLYKNEGYRTFERTGDIYALFYEKGINILNRKGLLCYITSNKWMRAAYGASLRAFFSTLNPLKLIDMGPGVFNAATVDTNILLIAKQEAKNKHLKALTLKDKTKLNSLAEKDFLTLTNPDKESWIILSPEEQRIKEKIERIGTPLKDWDIKIYRGVLTGFNEAFIIDGKTKEELIARDAKSAEIIKPILRGRDIKRYRAEFADLWLINTHNGYRDFKRNKIPPVDINEYPVVKSHLDNYWPKINKRQDQGVTPYNLRNCAYIEEFKKEKIVYQEMVQRSSFVYDKENNYFCLDTGRIITGDRIKFLLSIFNSKFFFYAVKTFYGGGGLGESGVRMKHTFFEKCPVPITDKQKQKPFEQLVDAILIKKEADEDTVDEEHQIDLMVYKLYDLTHEEIKVIDPEFAMNREAYEKYTLPV